LVKRLSLQSCTELERSLHKMNRFICINYWHDMCIYEMCVVVWTNNLTYMQQALSNVLFLQILEFKSERLPMKLVILLPIHIQTVRIESVCSYLT